MMLIWGVRRPDHPGRARPRRPRADPKQPLRGVRGRRPLADARRPRALRRRAHRLHRDHRALRVRPRADEGSAREGPAGTSARKELACRAMADLRKQICNAASVVTLPAALHANVGRATDAIIDIRDQLSAMAGLPQAPPQAAALDAGPGRADEPTAQELTPSPNRCSRPPRESRLSPSRCWRWARPPRRPRSRRATRSSAPTGLMGAVPRTRRADPGPDRARGKPPGPPARGPARGRRAAYRVSGRSPIQYRGPGPRPAALSPGFASWQRSRERHPHPMHSVSPALRRSSSAMRSSIRDDQPARELRPVTASGGAVRRELGELVADLLEGQADALREHDEGDAAEHGSREAAVAGSGPLRGDQAALLVEAQGGGGHAAAARHLADRELLCRHGNRESQFGLDFKLT